MNKYIIGLILFSFSTYSIGSNCIGKVQQVALSSSGELRIITSFRSDYFTVCELKGTWNNVSSETCMLWFSIVQQAYTLGSNISIHYPSGTSCNNFPIHRSAPKPNWIINHNR